MSMLSLNLGISLPVLKSVVRNNGVGFAHLFVGYVVALVANKAIQAVITKMNQSTALSRHIPQYLQKKNGGVAAAGMIGLMASQYLAPRLTLTAVDASPAKKLLALQLIVNLAASYLFRNSDIKSFTDHLIPLGIGAYFQDKGVMALGALGAIAGTVYSSAM